jgi:hypothetical protein
LPRPAWFWEFRPAAPWDLTPFDRREYFDLLGDGLAVVLDRPDLPSAGAGETPIVALAPAIANAIVAAGGPRLRSLPLAPTDDVSPLHS